MVQINQKWDRVLGLFFEYPSKKFTIREIAKKTKIPSSSVQRYLERLKKEQLVDKENKANITLYFRFLKAFHIINKMHKVGLIDYLKEELNPSAVIVFGSVRKGEYEQDSDIDLFIETSVKKRINLGRFERKLKHKIQLFVESNIQDLQENLFNNVINGIKLYGSFKIK